MAEYSEARPGFRAFILLLLIIVLALGGIIWFDYLGLVDARSVIAPVYRALGFGGRTSAANADDPNLLDKERLAKQQEALVIRQQELDSRKSALDVREKQLNQLGQDLNDRQAAIDAQQKALNDSRKTIEDRRVNLDQNAVYLTSMPPQKAVDILAKQDDQYVIDTFRTVEAQAKRTGADSLVPIWLSLMPSDRAATLQRKMAGSTGG